jgi:hypothetical protein
MTKSKKVRPPLSIEAQIKQKERQKRRFNVEGAVDGRPRDKGDLLDALKREHHERDPDKIK